MGPGRSVHFAHSVSVHPGTARYVYGVGWEVEGAGGGCVSRIWWRGLWVVGVWSQAEFVFQAHPNLGCVRVKRHMRL